MHMIKYLEKNYIGKLDPSGVGRLKARLPIPSWNLFDRVLLKLPSTNNCVEPWHSQISASTKKHLKVKITILVR